MNNPEMCPNCPVPCIRKEYNYYNEDCESWAMPAPFAVEEIENGVFVVRPDFPGETVEESVERRR